MDSEELRKLFRDRVDIRIGPHTGEYVARKLCDPAAKAAPFPVMGGDARTGVPVRMLVEPALLLQAQA